LFDPRREHSFVPITNPVTAATQGLSRLAAALRPPRGGLSLIGPSTAACLPAWA